MHGLLNSDKITCVTKMCNANVNARKGVAMELYDVAQICPHGHVVNDSVKSFSDRSHQVCEKCGEKAISSCPICNRPIRGHFYTSETFVGSEYRPPSFCYHCNSLFPWAQEKMDSAEKIFCEHPVIRLSRHDFFEMVDDLVRDTHHSRIAMIRFKTFLEKLDSASSQNVRELLYDVVTENARKYLWNDG